MPTPERFFFAAGILIPARGIGVVGAVVTSVGASAVAVRARGGGGRRPLCAVPVFGEASGCSGQTAVAKSSMVGNRRLGAFDKGRENPVRKNVSVAPRVDTARRHSYDGCFYRI